MERWPPAVWEAAEDMVAGWERMQPGCKALGWEGRLDQWLPDMTGAVPA